MNNSEGRVLSMKHVLKKNMHKVFLIDKDQKRQIQIYWFEIKTNATFRSERKARLTLGSWVNDAEVLWTVSTTAQNKSGGIQYTYLPAPKFQLSAFFVRNPLLEKPAWAIVYCRCSTTVVKSSAATSVYLSPGVSPHCCTTTGTSFPASNHSKFRSKFSI